MYILALSRSIPRIFSFSSLNEVINHLKVHMSDYMNSYTTGVAVYETKGHGSEQLVPGLFFIVVNGNRRQVRARFPLDAPEHMVDKELTSKELLTYLNTF